MTQYDTFQSPLGELTIATDGEHLTALHIEGDRYFTEIPSNWQHSPEIPVLRQAREELEEYFKGERTAFNVPVKMQGTPFQQSVWDALQQIPAGSTSSYSDIAQHIGRPNAVRAVGTAIGRNPICIIVPCHRVLASNGSFGGYVAGIACKQQLLAIEGHRLSSLATAAVIN